MTTSTLQPNTTRIPWLLRSKIEVSTLQFVGRNAIGLPYLQGQIRNRSNRPLSLQLVARVLNDQQQPVFSGTPSILGTFVLEPHQQRAFRISLSDVSGMPRQDRERLWVTRSSVELSIEG